MIPNVKRAVIIREDAGLHLAKWPNEQILTADLDSLATIAESQGTRQVKTLPLADQNIEQIYIAETLKVNQLAIGTLVLEVQGKAGQQDIILKLLDWGKQWLSLVLKAGQDKSNKGSHQLLNLLEESLQQRKLADICSILATGIADYLKLERVSIAIRQNQKDRLVAISKSAHFDDRNELSALMSECATEAMDMLVETQCPSSGDENFPAAQKLQVLERREQVFCVPLIVDDHPVGAIVCERGELSAQWAIALAQTRLVSRIIGPIIKEKISNKFSFIETLKGRYKKHLKQIKARPALAGGVAFAVFLILFVIPLPHRVSSDAHLEGQIQRAIVAPEDGYLKKAMVRAGEELKEGDLVAELDDSELKLEFQRWNSEKEEYSRLYGRELTALNHTQMRIYKAKLAQAEAQANLYLQRMQRTKIAAPIDGVVIKGDLSRAIGGPVERGQVLFEIAPANAYRLVIEVDEKDIRHIKEDQKGYLVLSSLPSKRFPFQLRVVSPLYSESEKGIRYRVEALLLVESADLKPGMSGVAKVSVGHRNLVWSLLADVFSWISLRWWMWTK